VAAEQRLAELERQQRNRVAIHQAASMHNANVVKRFLANPGELASVAANTGSPRIEVKQMGKIWNASTSRSVPPAASFRVNADGDGKLVMGERVSTAIALTGVQEGHEDEDIEVIIVTGEGEHQESFLKSILKNQRAAFGDKDIVVAQTLKHLGELMSDKQEWEESEDYFREAFEILKDKAADNPQFLSEIRVRLIDALRKQGHLEKAVKELRDLKINLDDVEIPEKLSDLMGRLKIEVQQAEEDDRDR
jgi:hypothetical protein